MDNRHSKVLLLLLAGWVVFYISQAAAFGITYLSFGMVVNQSFGPEQTKSSVNVEIFVPFEGKLLNIDIALNIEHPSFCDLKIYLESPNGTPAYINGYDVYNFVAGRKSLGWIVLDEESPFDIDRPENFCTGLFKPNGPDRLSMFYGQQSFGMWNIRIADTVIGDTGILKEVRMDLVINPEPSTLLLAAAGAAFMRIRPKINRGKAVEK